MRILSKHKVYNCNIKNNENRERIAKIMVEDLGLINKIDSEKKEMFKIRTTPTTHELQDILRYIDVKQLRLPDIQREAGAWGIKQKKLFIDSIIFNYPIPPMMFLKYKNIKLLIDGQQRLTTIIDFIEGGFSTQPSNNEELSNKKFNQLPKQIRSEIMQREVLVQSVQQESPDPSSGSFVFEVFSRINTGSTKLKPQEVRFATYHGEFSKWLKKFSKNQIDSKGELQQLLGAKDYVELSESILRIAFMYGTFVFDKTYKKLDYYEFVPRQFVKKTINLTNALNYIMELGAKKPRSIPGLFETAINTLVHNVKKIGAHNLKSISPSGKISNTIQKPTLDAFIISMSIGDKEMMKFSNLSTRAKELVKVDYNQYKNMFQVQTLNIKSIERRINYVISDSE